MNEKILIEKWKLEKQVNKSINYDWKITAFDQLQDVLG